MADARGTRDKILEAAIGIIEAEGEAGVRVDRVVEAASFTKPVLYHHFADREDLVIAAQGERYRRTFDDALVALSVFREAQSQDVFLDRVAIALGDFTSPEGRRRRRMRAEILGAAVGRPQLHDAITEANRQFVASLGDFLTRARKAGLISPQRDPRDIAAWWLSVVAGRYVIDVDADRFDEEEWTAIVLSMIRYLLAGER
jgi:AcrR family transcriptional regulator